MCKRKNVYCHTARDYAGRRMWSAFCFLAVMNLTAGALSGCSFQGINADVTEPVLQEESSLITNANDNSEADSLNVEFVKVVLVAKDHIMLENTKDERYWVDIKYSQNYDVGDSLCLVYQDKTKTEDGYWKVVPSLLYVNDNSVDILVGL